MMTAINFLKSINKLLIVSLFLGMFIIALFSLIALSPVAYEDYAFYKQNINNSAENKNQGQVAGVTSNENDEDWSLTVTNLLDKKSNNYRFERSEAEIKMQLSIDSTNKDLGETPLLRVENKLEINQKFDLAFTDGTNTFAATNKVGLGLLVNNKLMVTESDRNKEIEIPAGGFVEISLVTDPGIDVIVDSNLFKDQLLGFKLSKINEDKLPGNFEQSGGFLKQLP